MSNYNINAILSARDAGFSSQMKAAINQLENLDSSVSGSSDSLVKMGASFGAVSKVVDAAMSAISSAVGGAVDRFDTLNRFSKIMEQLGFSTTDASEATDKLKDGIQGLPTSLSEITASTQSIALLTGDLEEATDISLALNDAFLASGSSSADAARGLTQYSQMLSAGKVDMQSWRTLLETMGTALNDVAAEFGFTGASAKNDLYSALQDGTITFDQFNTTLVNLDQGISQASDSFVSFADRALTASEGIGTSFQNIKTAIVTGLANMLTTIDTAMQDAGLGSIAQNLNNLKTVVANAFSAINSVISGVINAISPILKNLAENMDLVAVSVGALVTQFVALKVINTVKSWVSALKSAIKTSGDTIKKYNTLLEKYGSKQKAAAKATEDTKRAKDLAKQATEAQMAAEEAARNAKQKYIEAMEAEARAQKEGATNSEAKEAAERAQAEATEANIEAEKKKLAAETASANATKAATTAEESNAAAQTLSNTQITLKTALLGVLSGEMSIATAAQQAFNAALSANPIGFVITAVTTLISVVTALSAAFGGGKTEAQEYAEQQEKICNALDEAEESLAESTAEHENNIAASKEDAKAANELVGEIEDLQGQVKQANAEGKDSSSLTSELKSKVSELNSTLGDTAYEYDETTNALSATTDEMKSYIKQAQKQNEVNELTELQTEQMEKLSDARGKLTTAEAEYNAEKEKSKQVEDDYYAALEKGEESVDTLMWKRDTALAECNEKMEKASETMAKAEEDVAAYQTQWEETSESLTTAQGELTEAQEAYNTVLEESANDYALYEAAALQAASTQYQANQEMLANGTLLYDQLSEKNQELVDTLNETWDMYYEANTNMWETLADDSSLSVDEMIANMQANQEATQQMATNLGSLRDTFANLGLDTAVLDQLESLGIESANEIANLTAATPEQLTAFANAFTDGGTKAGTNLTTGLGSAAENLDPTIQNMIGETHQGISDAIASADWAELGEAEIQGIVEGIEGISDDAVDAVTQVATDGYKGYQSEIKSGSPSKVYAGYGEDQMTGLIQGINKRKGQVKTLMENVAKQIQTPFKSLNSVFQSYGAFAMSGFINGLNSRRSSVMSVAQSIANAASDTVAKALVIGSPSKLMYKYGAWTGEGFENGLESRISPMEKLATKVSDVMSEIFVPRSFDKSYGADLALSGGFTYSMDGFSSDIEDLIEAVGSRPIQIDNRLDIDGRTFAKTTTPYITQEQTANEKFTNYRKGIR